MFIIDNNSAYLIFGDKAKRVKFNTDLSYKVTEEELENIGSYAKYTYDEVMAKLNVRYFMSKALEELENKASSKEFIIKIEELENELKEKDKIIENLKKELETLKKDIKPKKEKDVSNEK